MNWRDLVALLFSLSGIACPLLVLVLVPDRTAAGPNLEKIVWSGYSILCGIMFILVSLVMSLMSIGRYGFRNLNSFMVAMNLIFLGVVGFLLVSAFIKG